MNGLIKFMFWIAGICGAICVILYYGFFDVWRLPVDDPQFLVSIEPTLSGGDLVLVSRHGAPSSGNVVRCADPDAAGRFVVGRIIGTTGDTVDLTSETITVNGQHSASPRACVVPRRTLTNPQTNAEEVLACSQEEFAGGTYEVLRMSERPEPSKPTKVEPNKVFLVSDNRHMHLDSRDFAAVDPSSCAHIAFRLWGLAGFGDAEKRFSIIW